MMDASKFINAIFSKAQISVKEKALYAMALDYLLKISYLSGYEDANNFKPARIGKRECSQQSIAVAKLYDELNEVKQDEKH